MKLCLFLPTGNQCLHTYPYLSPGSAQASMAVYTGPVQPPVAVDTSSSETESEQTNGYSYFVKMINHKKE